MHKTWRLAAAAAGCALLPVSIALADCAAEIEALNAELGLRFRTGHARDRCDAGRGPVGAAGERAERAK